MNFNKDNAPITCKLINDIEYILSELNKDDLKKLKYDNYELFKDTVFERNDFHEFIDNYFNVFMLLIDKNKVPFDILYKLINFKGLIEAGQLNQNEADNMVYDFMNDKYIYSKFGSKENFEKHILNNH